MKTDQTWNNQEDFDTIHAKVEELKNVKQAILAMVPVLGRTFGSINAWYYQQLNRRGITSISAGKKGRIKSVNPKPVKKKEVELHYSFHPNTAPGLNGQPKKTPDINNRVNDKLNPIIVQNAREKIAQLEISNQQIQPEYQKLYNEAETAKALYDEAKQAFDTISVQVLNFKEQIADNELIIKTYSPVEKKPAAMIKKQISWLQEAYNALKAEDRFMNEDELWNAVIANPEVAEILKTMKSAIASGISTIKCNTIKAWTAHAMIYFNDASKTAAYKPFLAVHNDLFGCYDWVDQQGIPKPQYLKEFMYNKAIAI